MWHEETLRALKHIYATSSSNVSQIRKIRKYPFTSRSVASALTLVQPSPPDRSPSSRSASCHVGRVGRSQEGALPSQPFTSSIQNLTWTSRFSSNASQSVEAMVTRLRSTTALCMFASRLPRSVSHRSLPACFDDYPQNPSKTSRLPF